MTNRAPDWLAQARRDLEQAASSTAEGRHEWACFAAQQSAEKASRRCTLRWAGGLGSCCRALLVELPVTPPDVLVEKGRVLDSFYIPTRYANGHPEGAPFEHYGSLQSEEAIRYAREIIEFVDSQMA